MISTRRSAIQCLTLMGLGSQVPTVTRAADSAATPEPIHSQAPRLFNHKAQILIPRVFQRSNPPPNAHLFSLTRSQGYALRSFEAGQYLSTQDVSNTFSVFQLSKTEPKWLEPSDVQPAIEGGDSEPDVLLNVQMMAFHIGSNESVDKDTKATLRLTVSKDDASPNKMLEKVFWAMSAAMSLWDQNKQQKAAPKDLATPLSDRAFANRPIEIPGGVGDILFEVVKHKPTPWWDEVVGFFTGGTGQQLLSLAGFPAVTTEVMTFLDNMLDQFTDNDPAPLFSSNQLQLAFSTYARDSITGGYSSIKQGCLTSGYWLLVRGRDHDLIAQHPSIFYPEYGMLIPSDKTPADVMKPDYADPFDAVTYAVLKAGVAKANLSPNFHI